MGNPSSVLVGKATFIKWPVQISPPERGRPVSQQVARTSGVASLKEQKGSGNRNTCEEAV